MKELTYILGAGASFQSIPVVKTFPKRFDKFIKALQSVYQKNESVDKRDRFNSLYNRCINLCKEFESHQSFDTYFKKLFHTKSIDKIKIAKKILNLYFIWEHLNKDYDIVSEKIEGDVFLKQAGIDKRYDALIAGLLQPISGKAEPYCKVNFITWNYDLNLLSSLKNYFFPNDTFEELLKEKIKIEKGIWVIEDKISIINMNGYFYSSKFNSLSSLDENYAFDDFIYKKINTNGYFEDTHTDNDAEQIKFAWEEVSEISSTVEIAKEKIENSGNIIVIGYTFPLYNRLIDLKYLKQTDLIKKNIIIQDPNADLIKQNIKDIYGIGQRGNIKAITDCDSFYVPSTIFGIKEMDPGN
jgi:hypothetical protein